MRHMHLIGFTRSHATSLITHAEVSIFSKRKKKTIDIWYLPVELWHRVTNATRGRIVKPSKHARGSSSDLVPSEPKPLSHCHNNIPANNPDFSCWYCNGYWVAGVSSGNVLLLIWVILWLRITGFSECITRDWWFSSQHLCCVCFMRELWDSLFRELNREPKVTFWHGYGQQKLLLSGSINRYHLQVGLPAVQY